MISLVRVRIKRNVSVGGRKIGARGRIVVVVVFVDVDFEVVDCW
jgi:hypothetical protein